MQWLIKTAVGAAATLLSGQLPAYAAFEVIGQGARAIALAGAFTAVEDDPETVWFNPAGSARVTSVGVGLTHAQLYPGLEESPGLNALSVHFPLSGGGAQLGLSLLSHRDWSEQILVAGYGRPLHPRVAVGGNVSSMGWQIGGLSRRTLRVDIGGAYEVGWVSSRAYVRLGLKLSNLTRANIAASGHRSGRTPVGGVVALSIDLEHQRLLLDLQRQGENYQLRTGYETRPEGWAGFQFRMGGSGLVFHRDSGELDVGLGHVWREWLFDYAYSYPLTLGGFGGIHWVSVRWQQQG